MFDHGTARLIDYQDARYADLYAERVRRVLALEERLDASNVHDRALTRETARFLALWMAFDDIVRVADLKTRTARYARIRAEVGARRRRARRPSTTSSSRGWPRSPARLPAAFSRRVLDVGGAPSCAPASRRWPSR